MDSARHIVALALLIAIGTTVTGLVGRAAAPQEKDGRLVVPVLIDGHGPFRFRLDTGSTRTVISARVAGLIGARSGGWSTTVTQTGTVRRPLTHVDRVAAGCLPPAPATVLVVPDGELGGDARVDGLIGQDVIGDARYTLDFAGGTLSCGPETSPTGRRLPLSLVGGQAVVSVPSGDGLLHLIADSGADRLVMFERAGGRLPAMTPLDMVLVRSLTGHRLARRVLVQGLALGRPVADAVEGVLMAGDPAGGRMADGLLPLQWFSRVTVDGPGGWLMLGPSR